MMLNLDTRVVSIDRAAYCLAQLLLGGQAFPCVRSTHWQEGLCAHVLPLRCEDAAPIEDIFICRRCAVLAFLRTSVDNRVDLVSYFCYVPRPGTPAIMARRVVRRALSLSLSIPTISAAGSRGIGGPQYGCVPQVQQYLNFPTMSFGRV